MNKNKEVHGCRIGIILVLNKGVHLLTGISFHKHKDYIFHDLLAL